MSAPIFTQDALFAQRLWKSCGLYDGKLDGDWGPKTQGASNAFDVAYAQAKSQYDEFDPRTESVIMTLLPKAQVAARQFMTAAKAMPFVVKLLSGTRSYAEQDRLFVQRPKVTNARGGQSNHNFGIAWDVGVFINGAYDEGRNDRENAPYAQLAGVAKVKVIDPAIEWGGDWVTFKDLPHYQLKTGKTVSQCRALLEVGQAYA